MSTARQNGDEYGDQAGTEHPEAWIHFPALDIFVNPTQTILQNPLRALI